MGFWACGSGRGEHLRSPKEPHVVCVESLVYGHIHVFENLMGRGKGGILRFVCILRIQGTHSNLDICPSLPPSWIYEIVKLLILGSKTNVWFLFCFKWHICRLQVGFLSLWEWLGLTTWAPPPQEPHVIYVELLDFGHIDILENLGGGGFVVHLCISYTRHLFKPQNFSLHPLTPWLEILKL